jgi:hypothetical protein
MTRDTSAASARCRVVRTKIVCRCFMARRMLTLATCFKMLLFGCFYFIFLFGDQGRGSGVALVRWECHHCILDRHVLHTYWLGWVSCRDRRDEKLGPRKQHDWGRPSAAGQERWFAALRRQWRQSHWCCYGDLLLLTDGRIGLQIALGA